MLKLREFLPRDDAALISWVPTPDDLYLFTGPRLTWPLDSPQLDELRADPSFTAFTAVDEDEQPAGHVELVGTGEHSARLARVLVDPALRGRGLGEQLVLLALVTAKERGIRQLALFVFPGNARAIALYEKLGFEHRGPSDQLSGALLMELELEQP